MSVYLHFRCLRCNRVFALQLDERPNPKKHFSPPACRSCGRATSASGYGSKKLRSGAILLTTAMTERLGRGKREAVLTSQKRQEMFNKNRNLKRDPEEDSDSEEVDIEDDGDEDYLPAPNHAYHISMRATPALYGPRANYTHDTGCVLPIKRDVLGTAGRLDLNAVMGKFFGSPTPPKYPAWRHAGTTCYSTDKFSSSEWCHLVADSLGGPSIPTNLVAASFSANTYMAALEALLKGQSGLTIEVTVHCSAPHLGEWIYYRIRHRASNQAYDASIDARATAFGIADLTRVQKDLQKWLGARGIKVKLSV